MGKVEILYSIRVYPQSFKHQAENYRNGTRYAWWTTTRSV